uniref:Putative secreted protein n=1 Tax=Ixodes ricinus TaxID=34613 RepID=A0A6B0U2E8_IXORI
MVVSEARRSVVRLVFIWVGGSHGVCLEVVVDSPGFRGSDRSAQRCPFLVFPSSSRLVAELLSALSLLPGPLI